jgi:hypothetical protein
MKFRGALVKEQGVTFGIVTVKPHVISNRTEADALIASFQHEVFVGHPVVLMAQDAKGTPSYYGRKDIVGFLAHVPLASIPWKEYTLT